MFEELKAAGQDVQEALERYFRVCSSIRDSSLQGVLSRDSPKEYSEKIEDTLVLVEAYEARIQDAKQAIRVARNNAFHITPINSLPSEILVRILYFASRDNWCNIDYAAQVCSRWRSIAIHSCSLWSYVCYCPHQCGSRPWTTSLGRLQAHTSRAGRLPLDMEIYMDPGCCDESVSSEKSRRLFTTIAPRVRSLELDIDEARRGPNRDLGGFSATLKTLLLGFSQGSLKHFKAVDDDYHGIMSAWDERTTVKPALPLRVSWQQLEDAFVSVTSLSLDGLFFNWASKAYHGLVDLRMSRGPYGCDITSSQLRTVLGASPGLQTLHFGIHIHINFGEDMAIPLIQLSELESLHVDAREYDYVALEDVADLLRLIAPGPKPLELHLCDTLSRRRGPSTLGEVEAFIKRSNIVNLSLGPHAFFTRLSALSPNLKVLKLEYCENNDAHQLDWSSEPPSLAPKLEFCFISYCSMQLDDLLSKIDGSSREIYIKESSFYRDGKKVKSQAVKQELLAINPQLIVDITDWGRVKGNYRV